jgi:MoaE-MoaD fusion protein
VTACWWPVALTDGPTPVHIRVRLFAIQRQLAGTREVELDLEDRSTIEDAWTAVVARFPVLAAGRRSLRFARNGAYAEPETVVEDGDEVAFIPPVSGGAGRSASSEGRILALQSEPFAASVLADLEARLATAEDGAVVSFVGRTRVSPGTPAPGQEAEAARYADRLVDSLEYEAHESMAMRILTDIADEIVERFAVERLAILHRTGTVPLGEASIVVVAAAAHRDAAFAAARYAIDETKARAPIWKAEQFSDGAIWIGEPARVGAASESPPGG